MAARRKDAIGRNVTPLKLPSTFKHKLRRKASVLIIKSKSYAYDLGRAFQYRFSV